MSFDEIYSTKCENFMFVRPNYAILLWFENCYFQYSFSPLKVNLEKCEACFLGRAKFRDNKPIACKWTALKNDCIRLLVSFFSYDAVLSQK